MPSVSPPETLVACLCAAWCGTCGDYADTFKKVRDRLQAEHAGLRFLWVDIEDESDLIDPIEVGNFPTVLIANGEEPRFLGPLTPQPETLMRLVRAHLGHDGGPAIQDAEVRALVARLRKHHRVNPSRTDP